MPFRFRSERLLPWLRRRRAERDIRRELDLHLDLETRQNLERGMSPEEAARAARAALGNVPLIREDVRAVWKWRSLDQLELRGRARTLQVSAYLPPGDRTLTGFDRPLRLSVVPVAGDLLARLGRTPTIGPGFRLDDERPGAAPAAILSHVLWRQRFGSDRTIVGRTLLLDGVAHTVRGIMPPDFEFPSAGVDLWVPMTVDATIPVGLWARSAFLIGRLRPGATLESAAEEIRALGPQFGQLFPWRMPDGYGTRVSLRTWRDDRLGEVRPMLFLLLAAVVAVWPIGAVNLTNLQQVRAAARLRELALRTALGAGRGRIVR